MAKRRRRGSGGHPAKVAKRRERRRRSHEEEEDYSDQRIASELCKAGAGLDSAVEAELFGSEILGAIWSQYDPFGEAADPEEAELELGLPLVEALTDRPEPSARGLLAVISSLARDRLGSLATECEQKLARQGIDLPGWAKHLGQAEIVRAVTFREENFDDGRTVWIESVFPDGERIALGVLVDHNVGGIAKDIVPADSIDQVIEVLGESEMNSDPEKIVVGDLSPEDAAAQILEAVATTDMYLDPPVTEDYPVLRALTMQRVSGIAPRGDPLPEPAEVDPETRELLLREFLDSAESKDASIGDEDSAAEVVSLAIDFAADYGDGRPLRWSPIVVELFMADWLPRKIVYAEELAPAVPEGLAAWTRFAGRKRKIPQSAVDATVKSIDAWVEPMREAIDSGEASPATSLIRAAGDAGVDLEDKDALDAFVKGWNAGLRDA